MATKKLSGYTIVELLVGMGLFVLIISATSVIFARMMNTYRMETALQKNIQDTQFALNLIAKTMRTSSILPRASSGDRVSTIRIFDYSQTKCIEYRFNNALRVLETRTATGVTNPDDCALPAAFQPADTFQAMFGGNVSGSFTYQSSNGDPLDLVTNWRVGRATIAVELQYPDPNIRMENIIRIQTSVSLRDYIEFEFNAFET